MATFLGLACYLAGTVLGFLIICGAIHKVASLLLPSSEDMQNLFSFIVTIILTAVVVTTPRNTYSSIAVCLLKTVCSMLLWCLLFLAILAAVIIFLPSAMEEQYRALLLMFTYTVTMILSKVLRMPSTSTLEIVCMLLFCFLLLGSMFNVAQKLVPSAMERYPGLTSVILVALMLLGTRMLWVVMSWSTPIQKSTLVFDDFPKAPQMNIILTAIQEMKVEQKKDMGKVLAAMACVSKVMEFVEDSLGPRRSACYKPFFQLFVGSTKRIREAARKAFGFP